MDLPLFKRSYDEEEKEVHMRFFCVEFEFKFRQITWFRPDEDRECTRHEVSCSSLSWASRFPSKLIIHGSLFTWHRFFTHHNYLRRVPKVVFATVLTEISKRLGNIGGIRHR